MALISKRSDHKTPTTLGLNCEISELFPFEQKNDLSVKNEIFPPDVTSPIFQLKQTSSPLSFCNSDAPSTSTIPDSR